MECIGLFASRQRQVDTAQRYLRDESVKWLILKQFDGARLRKHAENELK